MKSSPTVPSLLSPNLLNLFGDVFQVAWLLASGEYSGVVYRDRLRHTISPTLQTERTEMMTEGPHNPGQDLDLAWLEEVKINLPAVLRRAATYGTRRTVKQQWQAGFSSLIGRAPTRVGSHWSRAS